MRKALKTALATSLLLLTLTTFAQETGAWRASSNTARSITGDIALTGQKLTINFLSFPVVRVRDLDPTEVTVVFGLDATGAGSLYRLEIPATQKFLHKNTLCGTDETQWMATYASGRSLQIAFFSSPNPPVFTQAALSNSTDLCGTFSYSK
jgi:hypothetical protein